MGIKKNPVNLIQQGMPINTYWNIEGTQIQ